MMPILAIRSAMLTYFCAVVKLPMQDRFEGGSLRDSAALAVPQLLCRTCRPTEPHKPAMTVSRSGADHNRSAVSVQKPHRGPKYGAHWAKRREGGSCHGSALRPTSRPDLVGWQAHSDCRMQDQRAHARAALCELRL